MKKVVLCGGGSCCPTVEVGNETITFSDDFGGSTRLSTKEWGYTKGQDKEGGALGSLALFEKRRCFYGY